MLSMCFAMLQNAEDEPLFEEFYNKYNKLVYYIARDNLHTHEAAEDCVQEIFMTIAKNFHNIKGFLYDNRIEGFVRVVARNVSVDNYRRNKKHILNVVEPDISDFYNISDEYFDVCDQMDLKEAIDNLPEEIKCIFYLKYICGYSGAEISQMLGIGESLIRKRCMIGRNLAKEFIERGKK